MIQILSMALLVALSGCGVESVVVGKNPLVPVELEEFEQKSLRLTNVRFFLWRDNMTADDASAAKKIGNRLDELDQLAIPLNDEQLRLENELEPVKDSYMLINKQLRSLKRAVKNIEKEKKAAVKAEGVAQKELDDLLKGGTPDPTKVKALEAKIAGFKASVATSDKNLKLIEPAQKSMQEALDEKRTEKDRLEGLLEELSTKQEKIFLEGQQNVDNLMKVVDYYREQPTSVSLVLEDDGSTRVSISNWNLDDGSGARNFSSVPPLGGGDPDIYDIFYDEEGGVYEFSLDVYTDDERENVRETYYFKFSRIKYDAEDGRTFFGGELERYTYDTDETRYGVVKLANGNN